MENIFEKNRKKMFNVMSDGDIAIVLAGKAPVKRGDENYPFSPDRHFYYFTGIDKENQILVLIKKDGKEISNLYIEPHNGQMAKWVGATMTKEEAKEISGIENIYLLEDFEKDMASISNSVNHVFTDFTRWDIPKEYTFEGLRSIFEKQEFIDLFDIAADFRTIKEPWEMERIEKAIEITTKAIKSMMKNSKAGMKENEIEAYYDFVLTKEGVTDKAFKTIAASGKNGTILHYSQNNSVTNDNDLILVDAGAQYKWYNGDITRTFPVNGKFTEKQKEIYNIVLNGQLMIIDMIKPGVEYPSLNEALKEYYYNELKKIGLVETKEDVFKYYYHNVSHFLGAETHDVGDRKQILKEGMVLTVEPGLYIEELGIGIRIEDDVLVTKNGCKVLSKDMIKTVEDIEKYMAEK